MQTPSLRPLVSGLLGILLLLPASIFMGSLLLRIFFGSTTLYYALAPSFLQSPFDFSAWAGGPWRQTGASIIFSCLLLAILFNGLALTRFHLEKGAGGWEIRLSFRRNWLNTAIALQGGLLLGTLIVYAVIQHVRY